MPRPRNIQRSVQLELQLPEDLYAKLQLHLYSPSEACVPRGAFKTFFSERIIEFFGQNLRCPHCGRLPADEVLPDVQS